MKTTNEVTTKVCSRCEKEKELGKFVKDKKCRGGYRRYCRECSYEAQRAKDTYVASKAFYRLEEKQAKYEIPINITREDVIELFANWGEFCVMCSSDIEGTPTLDHIVPMNRLVDDPFIDFGHHIANCFVACKRCNDRKKDLPLLTFYEQNERFTETGLNALIESMSFRSGISPENIRGRLELDKQRHELESELKANERKNTD